MSSYNQTTGSRTCYAQGQGQDQGGAFCGLFHRRLVIQPEMHKAIPLLQSLLNPEVMASEGCCAALCCCCVLMLVLSDASFPSVDFALFLVMLCFTHPYCLVQILT
ncbi:hypothetical protein HAX54_041435 [Datura stramonium]|uniref:Uncharacterized protein n=1 Tax=Datura stramonium TaxID=4076 RepID=A0ABS8SL72_DATST|nr:hypothetical protein [Datura stramonium]